MSADDPPNGASIFGHGIALRSLWGIARDKLYSSWLVYGQNSLSILPFAP